MSAHGILSCEQADRARTKLIAESVQALKLLAACGSHLIALGRPDLAPFGEQIVCPRCDGQTYDRGSCGLCRNVGWLDENGEALEIA